MNVRSYYMPVQLSTSLWRPTDKCGRCEPFFSIILCRNKQNIATLRGDEDKEIPGDRMSGGCLVLCMFQQQRHLQSSSKLIARMTGPLDKDTNKYTGMIIIIVHRHPSLVVGGLLLLIGIFLAPWTD